LVRATVLATYTTKSTLLACAHEQAQLLSVGRWPVGIPHNRASSNQLHANAASQLLFLFLSFMTPFRYFTPIYGVPSSSSGVHQPEDIVEHKVAPISRQQLKRLRVAHRALLLLHQQHTADNDEDAALGVRGLGVEGRDLVLDLLEWEVLMVWSMMVSSKSVRIRRIVFQCSVSPVASLRCWRCLDAPKPRR